MTFGRDYSRSFEERATAYAFSKNCDIVIEITHNDLKGTYEATTAFVVFDPYSQTFINVEFDYEFTDRLDSWEAEQEVWWATLKSSAADFLHDLWHEKLTAV